MADDSTASGSVNEVRDPAPVNVAADGTSTASVNVETDSTAPVHSRGSLLSLLRGNR
jgi:hypothetical protein